MKRWILALIAVCSMFLSGCQNLTSHGRTITVTGSGSAQVVPDIATFLVQVDETRPTTGEALAAANRKVAQVLEILKGQGIASKDIATQSVRLAPSYEWKDNAQVLVGQSSRQSISVKVRNLDQLGAVVDKLGLVDSISLASLAFDKEDKNDAYAEAREEAVRDAYAKAVAYAVPLSLQVGKARSIVAGGGEVMPMPVYKMAAPMAASEDSTAIERGTLDVSEEVTVVFELR